MSLNNMGGYPFPRDRLALARLDYCSLPDLVPSSASGAGDDLSCQLRARQCATYLSQTADASEQSRAAALLTDIVQPADTTAWGGAPGCLSGSFRGGCALLSSRYYGDDLWRSSGAPKVREAYRQIWSRPLGPEVAAEHAVPRAGFASSASVARQYAREVGDRDRTM
jgi:hypothetical protein